MKRFTARARGISGLDIHENLRGSELTTWRVGGPIRYLVRVADREALGSLLKLIMEEGADYMVIGNGSNLLISDDGYGGVAIKLSGELAGVSLRDEQIVAGGGASFSGLAHTAAKASLRGLEFAVGIPGTVGGAVITNAGAFGSSCAKIVKNITTMAPDGKEKEHLFVEDRYRTSPVPQGEIVLFATFRLDNSVEAEVRRTMKEYTSKRRDSQPGGAATAGSVFRNPEGDSAGRLLDQCGLKGKAVGGAHVSEKHANFIICDGGATAAEVFTLMRMMKTEVFERFGIELIPEVSLIGFTEEDSLGP